MLIVDIRMISSYMFIYVYALSGTHSYTDPDQDINIKHKNSRCTCVPTNLLKRFSMHNVQIMLVDDLLSDFSVENVTDTY